MRDAVKALVSAGAGLTSKDCGGMTASELAACMGFESVYEMLEGVPVAYRDLGQEAMTLKEGLSGRGSEEKSCEQGVDGKEDGNMKEGEGNGGRDGRSDDEVAAEAFNTVGMERVDIIAQTGSAEQSHTEKLAAKEPISTEEVVAENVVDSTPADQSIMTSVLGTSEGETTDEVTTGEVGDSAASGEVMDGNVPEGGKKKKQKKKKG
jgi:hypothetical protein